MPENTANFDRNRPCPCGSGKKYKRCCGSLTANPSASHADVSLGLSLLTGSGRPADPSRGIALIEKAAQDGDAQGAYLAATIASSSFWKTRDWDAAFDYLLRAAELGHEAARSALRILAGGPDGSDIDGDDWEKIRAAIDIDTWLQPPAVQKVREAPRIHVVEKFVPPAVCDWLIAQAQVKLARATIYDRKTGGTTKDYRRTNSQCDLDIETGGALTFVLRARIGAVIGRRDEAMEIPKVLHYAPGETFAEHFDYLDPTAPALAMELARRGQRTDTFLIYLNDDFTGGETCFTRISLKHLGAKGDALWFANTGPDGMPDPDTIHAGLPPTSGEKWLFSQWIRELPRG